MPSPQTYSSSFNPFSAEVETPPPTTTTFSRAFRAESLPREMIPNRTSRLPNQDMHNTQQRESLYLSPCYSNAGSWKHDSTFGFVHDGACSICNSYVQHTDWAIQNNEPSMTQAFQMRNLVHNAFFKDGYEECARLQRALLDETRRSLDRTVAEKDLLRTELADLRQRYAELENDSRRLTSSVASRTSPVFDRIARNSPSTSGSTLSLSSPTSSVGSFPDYSMHGITFTSAAPFSVKPDDFDMYPSLGANTAGDTWQPRTKLSHNSPTTTYASVASGRMPHGSADQQSVSQSSIPNHPPPSRSLSDPTPGSRSQRTAVSVTRYPRTIPEMKELMDCASEQTPAGAKALVTVKKFCLKAHQTHRDDKTPLQKWALINWRNPYSPSGIQGLSATTAKPNPRIEDPVEVWFDYLCVHPHSWPKGVRKDAKGNPFMPDLIANRAIRRMEPKEPGLPKSDFVAQVVEMFSVPGMYKELVEKNKFPIAPVVTYEFFSGPITVETVAQHFARSGVTLAEAASKFEPFAKSYKEF